jgi:hypothetical protein
MSDACVMLLRIWWSDYISDSSLVGRWKIEDDKFAGEPLWIVDKN